jgi:hypothetical protein
MTNKVDTNQLHIEFYEHLLGVADGSEKCGIHVGDLRELCNRKLDTYRKWAEQAACSHKNTTGFRYVGHDSHDDHYENRCLDCGKVLDTEYR